MVWDVDNPDEYMYDWEGTNNWVESSLNYYLNNDFYKNLNSDAKNMIDNAIYYLGDGIFPTTTYGSTEEIYAWERGKNVYSGNPIKWYGKIGLLYLSDNYYLYSKNVDNICFENPYEFSEKEPWGSLKENPGYPTSGWIYNSNIVNDEIRSIYTISTKRDDNYNVFVVSVYWTSEDCEGVGYINSKVRPTLYLSSSVKIIDGDGSSGNPYKLSL